MILLILIIIVAYLIGSIPSGYLIARARGITDIRKFGSGNIGATNVSRRLGIKYFFIVLSADCLKAYSFLRMLVYYKMSTAYLISAALAMGLGNGASIFLQGKGGKGIATGAGILLALCPLLLAMVGGVWVITLLITKTVGIASVVACTLLPLCALYFGNSSLLILTICMAVWSLWLHRQNIIKLYFSQA